ncbi:MAG: peptidyl-prolyl cis-trans isomerase [Candidatus Eisenbacteria bacterium]
MLQSMRQNTKTILWIVIAAFVGLIFAVWGADLRTSPGGPQGFVVGEVNGRALTADEFEKAFNDELAAYRGEEDVPLLPSVTRLLRERAWQRLVNSAIVENALKSYSVPISDEGVVYTIRTNPPEFLRTNEAFLTDGRFDYEKYRQAIDDPTVDWRWLENYVRGELPLVHLRQRVAISARVTEGELRDLYLQNNETVDFSLVAFLPSEFEGAAVSVSANEMAAAYEEHRDEFRVPERSSLGYVLFPIIPSEEDRNYLRTRMGEMVQRLREGTPFEDLARYHSEGPTAQQGGDIGSFRRGDLTPELEEVAFSLDPGEASEIIEGAKSFRIIQVVERTGSGSNETVQLRQIFMNVESGGETVEKARLAAEDLRKAAESQGLPNAAGEAGAPYRETQPFEEGAFVPGIGSFRAGNLFAFASGIGEVSEPIYHNDSYYVISVASRDSSHIEPFEAVSTRLREMVAREKRLLLARAEAERFRGEAERSDLASLARKAGREVRRADLVSRAGSVPTIGRDSRLILAAFAAPEKSAHGPVNTDFGSFYLEKEKVNPIDGQRYLTEKPYLIRSLLAQRQEYIFTEWIVKERERAGIKDMRPTPSEIEAG